MATIHPDRLGRARPLSAITLLVIHTAESSEGDKTAEVLLSLFASKGDRPNANGTFYGASYHAVADTDREWKQAVPDSHQAKAAAGANEHGLHICYPGRAGQTAAEWMDGPSTAMHHATAKWLAVKSQAYGIPLRRLTVAQVRAGERGVCAHDDVSKAFGKSDHWDPGPNFPWTFVLELARQYANGGKPAPTPTPTPEPEEDDDMPITDEEILKIAAATAKATADEVLSRTIDVNHQGKVQTGTVRQIWGWTKNQGDAVERRLGRLEAAVAALAAIAAGIAAAVNLL